MGVTSGEWKRTKDTHIGSKTWLENYFRCQYTPYQTDKRVTLLYRKQVLPIDTRWEKKLTVKKDNSVEQKAYNEKHLGISSEDIKKLVEDTIKNPNNDPDIEKHQWEYGLTLMSVKTVIKFIQDLFQRSKRRFAVIKKPSPKLMTGYKMDDFNNVGRI